MKEGWHLLPVPHKVTYVTYIEECRNADGSLVWETGGRATAIFIEILEKHMGDEGLYRHELSHAIVAFWALLLAIPTLGLVFLVTRSRWFRIKNEAWAYAEQ